MEQHRPNTQLLGAGSVRTSTDPHLTSINPPLKSPISSVTDMQMEVILLANEYEVHMQKNRGSGILVHDRGFFFCLVPVFFPLV